MRLECNSLNAHVHGRGVAAKCLQGFGSMPYNATEQVLSLPRAVACFVVCDSPTMVHVLTLPVF